MTHNSIKMLLCLLIIFMVGQIGYAQSQHHTIAWDKIDLQFPGNFKESQIEQFSTHRYCPIWVYSELTGQNKFDVSITNEIYEDLMPSNKGLDSIKNLKIFEYFNGEARGVNRIKIKVLPYRISNNRVERLLSFDLIFKSNGTLQSKLAKKGNKTESVLATGEWYKLQIKEDGVYKLDLSYFTSNGINTGIIDLSTIKIFGNGGAMLPEIIAENREDDLRENGIHITDLNSNNRLDAGDFIAFYAKGTDSWKDNASDYRHIKNVYSDYAYYFMTWGNGAGKRISESGDGQMNSFLKSIDESDYLMVHETETFNLRNSGREWFGEVLTVDKANFDVTIPDLVSPVCTIKSEVAIRTAIYTNVNIFLNDESLPFISHSGYPVNFSGDGHFADINKQTRTFSTSASFRLTYQFIRPQLGSEAWINYFEIQAKRKLRPIDGQIHFFNLDTRIAGNIKYQIEDFNSDYSVWDVNNPLDVSVQKTFKDGEKAAFIVNGNNTLLKYILFKNGSEKVPVMIGKIENQNLHSLNAVDYIIITHPDYKAQAEKLAKFHEAKEGYTYLITYPEKIYNEFSSGTTDITAIRDFVKMIYDREPDTQKKPKALLFIGDASFDYRNRYGNNGNFVPTFESYEYNDCVDSYCSDDYYVILGDGEGRWPLDPGKWQELLDMGVGRLPAKSTFEADVMIDKCIHYKTNSNKGEWRSSVTFLGDDEDFNRHIIDSDNLVSTVEKEFSPLNISKIYFDSYKQVSLGNGNAYPDVNEAINNSIGKGTLVFNYLGHGGGSGMGHERVVTRPQILGWKNYDKLTFFVTGTCDLAQFDNPKEESPGELMMNNNEGGAIGMMTTTRKVYIGRNTEFSEYLFKNNLFKRDGDHYTTFGQSYANVKNIMWSVANIRNYILLGDPILDLNLPIQKTIITSINGNVVNSSSKDTLKALSKVVIKGSVTNLSGNILNDFNGDVMLTLFDKKQTFKTLANDPESYVMPFNSRNNVLYRGKASVVSGNFSVSFIIPKDIDYSIGKGRIFTYAYNDKTDAVGIHDSAFVGGTAGLLANDTKGPDIELYLEDEKFVNGGIVDKNPLMILKLWDENGINTAGNGVGREILAVLDKGTKSTKNYILNDFYSTTLDSYQGGEVRFQLSDIAPGTHTLMVRAWDVYNNSSETQVDFMVATDENLVIKNLLNYPNPFTTKTKILFDHNKAGQELNITVSVFSVSGKIVKSVFSKISNAPSHIDQIEWDGKDDYGQPLGQGVYVYKIKVKSEDGKTEEEFQKMVVLK